MTEDAIVVEIVDIVNSEIFDEETLLVGNLEFPQPSSQHDAYVIEIFGWILGLTKRVEALELYADGTFMRRIPVDDVRPDVADVYSFISQSERSGFATSIGVLALAEDFTIMVNARFADGSLEHVWTILGHRQPIRPRTDITRMPIMVTTLGRTGSSHLIRMLGEHPDILVYRPFESETRFSLYNVSLLAATYDPTSYGPAITFADVSQSGWWLPQHRRLSQLQIPDRELGHWLGRQRVEQLIDFVQRQVEELYGIVATIQGKTGARYFAEKYVPDVAPLMTWSLYRQAREIFLVRDFRDMFCSILAFHRKRDYATFGRIADDNDLAYLRRLGDSAAMLRDAWKTRARRGHLVRYEDLIMRPTDVLRDLAHYLGIDDSPSMIEAIVRRSMDELPDQADHRTIDDPLRTIGRWRRDLSPPLQAACQEVFGDILVEFGYQLEERIAAT